MSVMRYVALLRGINVGGRIVKMADLKVCLEGIGFSNVKTLLQSGNVVFEADESNVKTLKQQMEAALTKTFDYPAKVQVMSMKQLEKIVVEYPFGTAGHGQHDYVIFIENGLEKQIVQEDYQLAPGEKVQAGNGVVYWRVDKGSTLKSSFALWLTKVKYKDFNTNRNVKTLRKLLVV